MSKIVAEVAYSWLTSDPGGNLDSGRYPCDNPPLSTQ